MTYDEDVWRWEGKQFGWERPEPAALWKRLPVIRHVRTMFTLYKVHRRRFGFRTGYDDWALSGMWRGYV